MKERPILFKAEMVNAILSGAKTQTRRLVNPQPPSEFVNVSTVGPWGEFENTRETATRKYADGSPFLAKWGARCPYGQPGDRLWVRESWWAPCSCCPRPHDDFLMFYRANQHDPARREVGVDWKPSIHMPRWASRITLEIKEVRVERLQDISEEDAWQEGFTATAGGVTLPSWDYYQETALAAFQDLWQSINGEGSWAANPWVWAVSFERVEERP